MIDDKVKSKKMIEYNKFSSEIFIKSIVLFKTKTKNGSDIIKNTYIDRFNSPFLKHFTI